MALLIVERFKRKVAGVKVVFLVKLRHYWVVGDLLVEERVVHSVHYLRACVVKHDEDLVVIDETHCHHRVGEVIKRS